MQVDWKEVWEVVIVGGKVNISLFVAALGYSKMKYAVFTTSQDQKHLIEGPISWIQVLCRAYDDHYQFPVLPVLVPAVTNGSRFCFHIRHWTRQSLCMST